MIQQAIILAAGKGIRLGELGKIYPKVALPVANRPLFELNIDNLYREGVRDFIFVMAPHSEDLQKQITNYLNKCCATSRSRFVIQLQPQGIANALLLCQAIASEHFMVMLGDTYFLISTTSTVESIFKNYQATAVLSVRQEHDEEIIRKECTVDVTANGLVKKIVEKPTTILSHTKPCGLYFFSRKIFEAIQNTRPSALRNEVEITDSISTLISSSSKVYSVPSVDFDVNISYVTDFLNANLRYLSTHTLKNSIDSTAQVATHAQVTNSVIGKAVKIGSNAKIVDSVVLSGDFSHFSGEIKRQVIFDGKAHHDQ